MENKIALVVPTIREGQIKDFLGAWKEAIAEARVNLYLVEDNEEKTFNLSDQLKSFDGSRVAHLCHRDAPPGSLECIHVKSPCCRQIGFLKAYNDNNQVIITLDDDVRPIKNTNIFQEFYSILTDGIPLWVDPLLNYRSRGYPARNAGKINIVFHVGSFLRIPDVDGETQLKFEAAFQKNPPQYLPRVTVVPPGQLLPVNGGICGFIRELTPYVHYATWSGELGYKRFDDIWMGIILKQILDHCGLLMSYGHTFVNHERASNAITNAKLEKPAREWNEEFWDVLDGKLKQEMIQVKKDLKSAYIKIAEIMQDIDNLWCKKEGVQMLKWLNLFS